MPSWFFPALLVLGAIASGVSMVIFSYSAWLRKQQPRSPDELLAPLEAAMPAPRPRQERPAGDAVTQVWHKPATPGNIPSAKEMSWEQELWAHLGMTPAAEESNDE